MSAALLLFAAVAGLGVAVVLAVYRSGDVARVARECAHAAVSQEREQVNRVLIANATGLRRAGRRQHAKVCDELLSLLKSRPLALTVDVRAFTRRRAGKRSLEAVAKAQHPAELGT